MTLRALCTRLLLPVVALTLSAAQPAGAAWPNSPLVNVPLCTASGTQLAPAGVADGTGGAIIVWMDKRSGSYIVYAQRISANGVVQWTADGVALCTTTADQNSYPVIAPDGAGGAIVVWEDLRNGSYARAYAQRISAAGTALWTANGVSLCASAQGQADPAIVPDGAGGAIVTWRDYRSDTRADAYAQRISAAGAVQWTTDGVLLCTGVSDQGNLTIASDGGAPGEAGSGAVVAWQDFRSGTRNDIYAQRVSATGVVQWTANGVAASDAFGEHLGPVIASDGAGGAILAWTEGGSGSANKYIFAQRVSAAGALQWPAGGVPLTDNFGIQAVPLIASDGAGGAVVAWMDERDNSSWNIYAQRLSATGEMQWADPGVALCTAAEDQYPADIVSDGAGGAIVSWSDRRKLVEGDVYARRISATGSVQWTADGVAVCMASGNQSPTTIVSDGAGGAIVAWQDMRSGSNDVYAQRVDRWGCLGAQPTITGVHDVLGDEGGHVTVSWNASPLDTSPAYAIGTYWIWRQVPSALAQSALARGARLLPDGATPQGAPRGAFRTTTSGTSTWYWELVDAQIAQGLPGYSFVAPTTCDSVAGANPRTAFMVEARGSFAQQWWFSDPDSGYSVDNFAPAAPAPFTGSYSGGTATLSWGASSATDFAVFRLYRGTSSAFVPGPGNLVRTQAGTGYVDVAGAPCFYKLAAVDIHANVSPYAFLQPAGTTDAPGAGLPRELALSAPAPNPLRGSCTMRLALPRGANVALAVYDQQGRRVRALLAGALPAGEHPVAWDGRDDGGRPVANGIFFVRCEAEGRTLTRRIVAIR